MRVVGIIVVICAMSRGCCVKLLSPVSLTPASRILYYSVHVAVCKLWRRINDQTYRRSLLLHQEFTGREAFAICAVQAPAIVSIPETKQLTGTQSIYSGNYWRVVGICYPHTAHSQHAHRYGLLTAAAATTNGTLTPLSTATWHADRQSRAVQWSVSITRGSAPLHWLVQLHERRNEWMYE